MKFEIGRWYEFESVREVPVSLPGLYVIRNRDNGKEYVGKSSDIRRRLTYHASAKEPGMYIHRAIRISGLSQFVFKVELTGEPADLMSLEPLLIEERRCLAPNGYNLTAGGEGSTGRVVTEETRRKLREFNLGRSVPPEVVERTAAQLRGRKLTAEVKLRMSAAQQLVRKTKIYTLEERAARAAIMRGRKASQASKDKMSAARKGNTWAGKRVRLAVHGFSREFLSTQKLANYLEVSYNSVLTWLDGTVGFPPSAWKLLDGELIKVCKPCTVVIRIPAAEHLAYT
jgi:group I intron endonuclease